VSALNHRVGDSVEDGTLSELPIVGDTHQQEPLALHRIRFAKGDIDPENFIGIRSPKGMSSDRKFVKALLKAYREDYSISTIIRFGRQLLLWCKKVSFADQ
jgi:hypothetical protein